MHGSVILDEGYILKRLLLFLGLLLFSIQGYAIAQLTIWPVNVALWPQKRMDVVHLINKGKTAVNIQVSAASWDIDKNGKSIEVSTGDFIFFPRLTTIAPGEDKSIRIGYNGVFPVREKPYRLYFEELPKLKRPAAQEETRMGFGVEIVLKLSVPLFVRQTKDPGKPRFRIITPTKTETGLRIGLQNKGNDHFQLKQLLVKLLDYRGRSIFSEQKQMGQRVLGQRRAFFNIALKKNDCARARQIEFQFTLTGRKSPYIKRFPIRRCVIQMH